MPLTKPRNASDDTSGCLPHQVSFGEAGARFCIGRYYGTVEMLCVSMSRIGGSQSIDFTALAALCTNRLPPSSLRVLRLSGNQLAGIDAVGGGERKEAGVNEILEMLQSGDCELDELDMSMNMLSTDDAQALLQASMEPSAGRRCSVRQLRINQWAVPVELLVQEELFVLDLSRQKIGPPDAELLAATLLTRRRLQPTCLNLSGNALGTEGALTIVRAIVKRASGNWRVPLRELHLANVKLRAEGAALLLRELQHLPSLVLLDLSSNPLLSKVSPSRGSPLIATDGIRTHLSLPPSSGRLAREPERGRQPSGALRGREPPRLHGGSGGSP